MQIADAQHEMRVAFLGGFMGQFVSGALWLGSAGLATWGTPRQGITFLIVGGIFIFPLTQLGLRMMGRPGKVGAENSLYGLGAQVAMVLPLTLPVVAGVALYRLDWFYPSVMVLLGAHYLPFVFLYGMRMFLVLGAVLWVAGLALALWVEAPFAAGAWFTAVTLFLFAFVGRSLAFREARGRAEDVGAV